MSFGFLALTFFLLDGAIMWNLERFGHLVLSVGIIASAVLCVRHLGNTLHLHGRGWANLVVGSLAFLAVAGILVFGALVCSEGSGRPFNWTAYNVFILVAAVVAAFALWSNIKAFGVADGLIVSVTEVVLAVFVLAAAYLATIGAGPVRKKRS